MATEHKLFFCDSRDLSFLKDSSIDLTVTSPPYPMIGMWDSLFSEMNPNIASALEARDGRKAFALMHTELDRVWEGLFRVTKEGGFVAINIGDATRRMGDSFRLYSNHSRITNSFLELGFDALPIILWKKSTNSPTKFMGSGMLPAGAYVTLEHEYILLFRKGHKREFRSTYEKEHRRKSAFFWEERNTWFSDTWDLAGVGQNLAEKKTRKRSAAYPFELAYRLINMYSCKNDTILDPFLGTGTSSLAAAICERNSIGVELEPNFRELIWKQAKALPEESHRLLRNRIQRHFSFIEDYTSKKGAPKHKNECYGFRVVTAQERDLVFSTLTKVKRTKEGFVAEYSPFSYFP